MAYGLKHSSCDAARLFGDCKAVVAFSPGIDVPHLFTFLDRHLSYQTAQDTVKRRIYRSLIDIQDQVVLPDCIAEATHVPYMPWYRSAKDTLFCEPFYLSRYSRIWLGRAGVDHASKIVSAVALDYGVDIARCDKARPDTDNKPGLIAVRPKIPFSHDRIDHSHHR